MFDYNAETGEIWLYDEIGPSYWGLIDGSQVVAALSEMKDKHVKVRINSPGGSVDEGIAIYNALKRHKGGVTTYADSLAASMGSYLMQAGERRIVAKNAMMMVHDPWSIAFGNATELRKSADILDKYAARMVPDYAKRSGKSEDEIRSIMASEEWYAGEEIIKAGFADEIDDEIDVEPMAVGISRIACKAPADLLALSKRQEESKVSEFPRRRVAKIKAKKREEFAAEVRAKITAMFGE